MVGLPTVVTGSKKNIPLVTPAVRRSPQLSKGDGYQQCALNCTPRKKKRSDSAESTTITPIVDLPCLQEGDPSPIPTDVLKG